MVSIATQKFIAEIATAAEVSGPETTFAGSDNGKSKDYCLTETVKPELFEQPSNGPDSADGSTFIMPPKKTGSK